MTLVEGSTFCICESGGDIAQGPPHGLFVRDTRVLSHWALTIDGWTPEPLTVQRSESYAATFIGHLPPRGGTASNTLLVIRRRYVGNGMREDITIRNTAPHPAACVVTLAAAADFADLFEVKSKRTQPGPSASAVAAASTLTFQTRRDERDCALLIQGDGQPEATSRTLSWRATVPARGEWTVSIEATPVVDGIPLEPHHPRGQPVEHPSPPAAAQVAARRPAGPHGGPQPGGRAAPQRRGPRARCASSTRSTPSRPVVAAGAPWFMTLFGRDSLLTSWMLLPWDDRPRARHPADAGRPPGRRGRPGVRGGAGQDPARGPVRPGRVRRAQRAQRLLRHAPTPRRCSSCCSASCSVGPQGRAPSTRCCRTPTAPLDWIETLRRRRRRRLRRVPPQDPRGPRQPGLEGLLGRHQLRRRHASPSAPIALAEVQGYVLRGVPGPRRNCAARRGRRDPAPATWRRKAEQLKRAVQRGVLAARPGLVRDRAGPRQAAGRRADLQHRALPVDRHRRRRTRPPPVAEHLLSDEHVQRLGNPHARHVDGRLQPDELPQRLGVAARQRAVRGRPDALRLHRARPAGRRGHLRRRRALRLPPARAVLRLPAREYPVAGAVPDLLLAAGVGGRGPAAAAAQPCCGSPRSPARDVSGAPRPCPATTCRCG